MLPKNSVSLAVEKKQVTSKEKSVKAEKDIKPEQDAVKVVTQSKLLSKKDKDQPQLEKVTKTKSKQFNQSTNSKSVSKSSTHLWKYGSGVTPGKILLASWNVNGIRAVIGRGELNKYVNQVKPDVLCINETKIHEEAFKKGPIDAPPGYHGYWNFCKCSAGYSGVAIFSKYLPISVIEDLPEQQHSQQGRVLTMEFEKFYLLTAYIPNAGQKLDRLQYRVQSYDKAFQKYCNQLKSKKTVIICGDLNVAHQEIDIANPTTNQKTAGFTKEERASFTGFLGSGWIDTFRNLHPKQVKYSWWSMRTGGRAKNIGWRLDYFLIDSPSLKFVQESSINNNIYGSDHCPIELALTL